MSPPRSSFGPNDTSLSSGNGRGNPLIGPYPLRSSGSAQPFIGGVRPDRASLRWMPARGRLGQAPGRLLCFVRPKAPVAQGIEHRPPEAGAQVRILPGAPLPYQHKHPLPPGISRAPTADAMSGCTRLAPAVHGSSRPIRGQVFAGPAGRLEMRAAAGRTGVVAPSAILRPAARRLHRRQARGNPRGNPRLVVPPSIGWSLAHRGW